MSKFPVLLFGLVLSILPSAAAFGQAIDLRAAAKVAPASAVATEMTDGVQRHRKPRIVGNFIEASRRVRKSIPRKAASANPVIYANIIDYATPGIYRFTPEQYEFTPVVTGDEFANSYGSTYSNGVFIGINMNAKAYKWNTDDWSQIGEPIWSELVKGTAMAANPLDGTIYSCAYDILGRNLELVTVDTEEFVRSSTIGSLNVSLMAIFFDSNGTMYAFDSTGKLYTVDTLTAELTLIGDTGIDAYFDGAAVIDPESGKCFYAVCDWVCGLYEVDLETAEASLLYNFDDEEELKSIFILPPAPEAGAPGNAEAFSCNFADGSLSGTISFTAPANTYNGTPGTGILSYALTVNESTTVSSGTCGWGDTVEVPFTASAAGVYAFSLTFSNDEGEGRPAAQTLWIGNDTPSAVKDISVKREGTLNKISWSAPTTTVHGGYTDFSALSYTVTRFPDNVVVAENISATEYSDDVPDGNSPESYTYQVTAEYAGLVSQPVVSNIVMTGVVFYTAFDQESDFDQFLSISLATEGPMWSYNQWYHAASVGYSEEGPVTAWLVSPGVSLTAGVEYVLTFETWCSNDSYNELLSVFISTSNVPAVLYGQTPALNRQVVNWESSAKKTLTLTFTPQTTGTHYITFNSCSPVDLGTLYVDNVMFYRTPTTALPAAPAITAELVGDLGAKITVTAPSLDTDGQALNDISRITLSRGENLVKTFENPAPGATLTFEETLPAAGSYYYTAVAFSANGRSEEATALLSAVVAATPQRPSGVNFAETANDGEVTVTWMEPSVDVKGQPLKPGSVTYNIYEESSTEPVATGLTGTSYTYQAVPQGEQKYLNFTVTAVNTAGESYISYSHEPRPFGTPSAVPYSESFAGMQTQQVWSFFNDDDYSEGYWLLIAASESPATMPVDNDGGMLAFSAEMLEDTAIATSGKIDLGDGQNPRLTFHYYANTDNKDRLDVFIDGGDGFKRIFSKVMRDDQLNGWVKATIDLTEYAGKVVRLRFVANSFRSRNFLLVDKIDITTLGNDLEATLISAPASVKCGVPFSVKAAITNNGGTAASDYKVVLYRDGSRADEQNGKNIGTGASTVFSFEQTSDASWNETVKYSFGIEFSADEVTTNNVSETASVRLLYNNYPTAANLSAVYTNESKRAVNIAWEAPDQSNLPTDVYTEDFEFFTPFEADPLCDWTFIDGDGDVVFGSSMFPFEGQNDPKAFVVLDADHFNQTYDAHSGHMYLASYSATTKQTDDWMISPELTGDAQTISFFARSYSDTYGLESFEILYSTGGTDSSDFVKISAVDNVPTDWTEYSAELPAGAKHFAIRCVSDMRFALFIDDVAFTPAVNPAGSFAIEGFNIYRNGIRLNQKPLLEAKYTDTALPEGEPSYSVSVVYDHGESPLCAAVGPSFSGIESVAETSFSAVALKGCIELTASGKHVAVVAADGKTVFSGVVNGKHTVEAATGVYIATSNNCTIKLIVK